MKDFDMSKFELGDNVVDAPVTVTGLDPSAQPVAPTSDRCVAKTATDEGTGTAKYFLRAGTAGPQNGRLFDPQNAEPGSLARRDGFSGKGRYDFRVVTRETYELYVRFLTTTNPSYLLQAERAYRAST